MLEDPEIGFYSKEHAKKEMQEDVKD